jgi:Cu/Ag efflux protein CusF
MRVLICILVSAVIFACGAAFVPPPMRAQEQTKPKSIAFFGRVESIDSERKIVTVKHGKIAGYMDSAATEHSIDEEAALKRLRPGDDIRATVYPNDLTLHHVQIVYRSAGEKGKASKK